MSRVLSAKLTDKHLSNDILIYSWSTTCIYALFAFDPRQCCLLPIIPFWLVTQRWDIRVGTSQGPRTLITLKCLDTSILNTDENHLITLTIHKLNAATCVIIMVTLGDEFNVRHFMSWTLQFFFWVIEFEENGKSIHVGSRIPLKKKCCWLPWQGCQNAASSNPSPAARHPWQSGPLQPILLQADMMKRNRSDDGGGWWLVERAAR
jgi:hypothetical protein